MRYLLYFGDGSEMVRCRDAHQALQLARLFVAWQTGQPAKETPVMPGLGANAGKTGSPRG
jgi:hypothetical protein